MTRRKGGAGGSTRPAVYFELEYGDADCDGEIRAGIENV